MGFLQIQFLNLLAILVIIASSQSLLSATPPNFPIALKPNCTDRCGDLSIPYPFGTTEDCYQSQDFFVTCNQTFNPPKAFLQNSSIEITNMSLDGQLRILHFIASKCYSSPKVQIIDLHPEPWIKFPRPFTVNSTANKFTAIGCDTLGIIGGLRLQGQFSTGCMATCYSKNDLAQGSCTGLGCCQTSIPNELQTVNISFESLENHESVWSFNNCSFAFVVEERKFTFSPENLTNLSTEEKLPMLVDWAIGNGTCEEAKMNASSYACKSMNSTCYNPRDRYGYRCSCLEGYQGNPYLIDGCQDVNECEDPRLNICEKRCVNTMGGFHCACPKGYHGDGRKGGRGCIRGGVRLLAAGLLAGFGLFLIMAISFWSYRVLKKRRSNQLKQAFFKRNGGLLLQQQTAAHDSILDRMKVFTSKELERATDKFNECRILGRGGQGTVYKGMLSDGRNVAVKKSKQVNEAQLVEFINEVVILSQINHRNVVKLLGCCLETEVPLLVYEFIPNGTLYELIHDDTAVFLFSWDLRLRIAAEIADALAYLHYATSIPIYHRDMKSNNILLDEKYRAKLSDFGISRSVAIDQTHLTTKVKGTFGYFDPEYFQTGKFTEKSDVYSFGVVLVELLTGQKPVSNSVTEEEERSLIMHFLMTMKENCLKTILDPRIVEQDVKEEHVAVANLAKRCLNLNGRKRPTIREVAMALESIRTSDNPLSVESKMQDLSYSETGTVESKMQYLSYSETDSLVLNGAETASSSWTLNND